MDDPLLGGAPSPHPPLSPSQLALARGRTYALFGRLYLHGLTEETLPYARAIPELSATLPLQFDPDEAAAGHHHLFGFNVFPYQSIFLDPAGLLGGDFAEAVANAYQKAGFNPDLGTENADHVGHELGFLAFLCRAECDARQDEIAPVIGSLQALQAEFFDTQLLPWLLPFALAVERQNHPFYAALAGLTLEFAAAHRADLDTDPSVARPAAALLPVPSELLADQETTLRDIAAYLLIPVYSGFYLSRDDIGRLARGRRLPSGFGGRQQMLLNLLRSAVTYDSFESLLATMQALALEWAAAYGQLAEQPALFAPATEWQVRADATAGLLNQMSDRRAADDKSSAGDRLSTGDEPG